MKVFHAVTVTLLIATWGQTEPAQPTHDRSLNDKYESLVTEWRNPDFLAREAAMRKLWEVGDRALPYLDNLSKSSDPELSQRALSLMRYIRAGISPSTPNDVAELVSEYSSAGIEEKKRIVSALEGKNAYRQIFHLLKWDKNPNHKALLLEEYAELGIKAAKAAIIKHKFIDAIELLELAPTSPSNSRASAFLRYRHNLLTEKTQLFSSLNVKQRKEQYSHFKYYVKAVEDLNSLSSLADSAGDFSSVAGAKLLQGDAHETLEYLVESESNAESKKSISAFSKFYSTAQLTELTSLSESLKKKSIAEDSERVREFLVRLQFLTGFKNTAEQLYLAETTQGGFEYYDSMEKPQSCNQIISLNKVDGNEVRFNFWAEHVVKQSIQREDEDVVQDRVPITSIIVFLHSRGEVDKSKVLTSLYLDALEVEGLDRWFEVVTDLFEAGLGEVVFPLVLDRGNQNNELEQIVDSLFQESQDIHYLWQFLAKTDKLGNNPFIKFGRLTGLCKTDANLLSEIENDLLKITRLMNAAEYAKMTEALAVAAAYRSDLFGALIHYRSLTKIFEDDIQRANTSSDWLKIYSQLAFDLSEWDDVISAHKLMGKSGGAVTMTPSIKLGIAYRKNGSLKKGNEIIAQAIDYSLMIPTEVNEVAHQLYIHGFTDEGITLWKKSLLAYNPTDWEYHYSLQYLSSATNHFSKKEQWPIASALYATENAILMKSSSRKLNPTVLLRTRFQFLFTRAMAEQNSKNKSSSTVIELLNEAHSLIPRDGLLADMFFPTIKEMDLKSNHQKWFDTTFNGLTSVIDQYPDSHNTLNTAAWVGARAVKNLDESLSYSERAIKLSPRQGAYLDTMGEVYFAKGDRKQAVKWGTKAVNATGTGGYGFGSRYSTVAASYLELKHQLYRFQHEKTSAP